MRPNFFSKMNTPEEYRRLLQSLVRPIDIQKFDPPPGLRIWIPAPHPDDFDAIALTLRFLQQHQAQIFLDVVSPSSSGVEDGFCPDDLPETKALVREQEQKESLGYFGLEENRLTFLHMTEDRSGDPLDDHANEEILEDRFRIHSPHLVFMPHDDDPNPGHQRVFAMFRRILLRSPSPLVVFLNRDPKTLHSRADAYFSFDEPQANWKRGLLRHHRSQQSRNLHQRGYGFDERILQTNRRIAEEIHLTHEYAESFELRFFSGSLQENS